jgi:hypothetical protein
MKFSAAIMLIAVSLVNAAPTRFLDQSQRQVGSVDTHSSFVESPIEEAQRKTNEAKHKFEEAMHRLSDDKMRFDQQAVEYAKKAAEEKKSLKHRFSR